MKQTLFNFTWRYRAYSMSPMKDMRELNKSFGDIRTKLIALLEESMAEHAFQLCSIILRVLNGR